MQSHVLNYLLPCGPSPIEYPCTGYTRVWCADCGDELVRAAYVAGIRRCQPCAITRNRAAAKKRNRLEAKRREWLEHPPYCRWEGYEL